MAKWLILINFFWLCNAAFSQKPHIECQSIKRSFVGYYVTMYRDNEIKYLKKKCKRNKIQKQIMIDYETKTFIVPRDSLTSTYIKKVVSGNIDYLSLESKQSQIEVLNEYLCKEQKIFHVQNLDGILSSDRFYKVKGIRNKSFKIKYVEGQCLWISISKKNFVSFWGTYSKNMILKDWMDVVLLSEIQNHSDEFKTNKKIKKINYASAGLSPCPTRAKLSAAAVSSTCCPGRAR